jgi:hypothetical protein
VNKNGNSTIFALAESIFMAAETVTPNAPATSAIFPPAAERRSESSPRCNRGLAGSVIFQPRMGREKAACFFFRPIRGWRFGGDFTYGCTVGYFRPLLRSQNRFFRIEFGSFC